MSLELALMQTVQALGRAGKPADIFFMFLTFLGEETFILLLLGAIYWCANKSTGQYLMLSLYISSSLNAFLKDQIVRLRPFMGKHAAGLRYVKVKNLLVDTLSLSGSYSFPSGHSQCAAATAAGLWLRLKKRRVAVCGIVLTIGVMLSRVYLGVHYPSDVAAGALVGAAVSFASYALFKRFYAFKPLLFSAAVLVSALSLIGNFTLDTVKIIALGLGMAAGILMDEKHLRFEVSGPFWSRLLRFVLGVLFVAALKFGLNIILPETLAFEALRHMILGLSIMFVWPLIFTHLKI